MNKIKVFSLLSIISIIVLVGCSGGYKNAIIGTWEGDFPYIGGVIRLEFNRDNSMTCGEKLSSELLNWDETYNGTYHITDENKLILDANGCMIAYTTWAIEDIEKDTMYLSSEGLTMVFNKVED